MNVMVQSSHAYTHRALGFLPYEEHWRGTVMQGHKRVLIKLAKYYVQLGPGQFLL